jgi:hypothetical protein
VARGRCNGQIESGRGKNVDVRAGKRIDDKQRPMQAYAGHLEEVAELHTLEQAVVQKRGMLLVLQLTYKGKASGTGTAKRRSS